MKKVIIFLTIFCSVKSFAQQSDTVFSIGGNSCNCIFREEKEEREARKIFEKAQQAPSFPGGSKVWQEFLKDNLSSLFSGEKEEFSIQFVVHPEGHLTDIRRNSPIIDNKFQEAKKILLLSGKWCPAVQQGRCVRAYHRISFKF
jgi:hypothetical protein